VVLEKKQEGGETERVTKKAVYIQECQERPREKKRIVYREYSGNHQEEELMMRGEGHGGERLGSTAEGFVRVG